MPKLDDDDDYQPGDSEFEDSGEDSDSEVEERPVRRTTEEIIRAAEKAAYQRGLAAARAEAARAVGKGTASG